MSVPYPRRPVDVLLGPVERFLHVESAAGVLLLACAVLALAVANSPWGESFLAFWQTSVGVAVGRFEFRHSLLHWINDGLMVLFFFVVGLEIKRELVDGELQTAKKAALPLAAALGGMMVPALIFLSMQGGEPASRGWGI
ncbi:MAG TPA: Na+/H+ antiporter NhaA, partial [Acidobacteriota bacterium]|nr:Na+/H+ antiporter NhaA [Acidobacteriota bacterium]